MHHRNRDMSATDYTDRARGWGSFIEKRERLRNGRSTEDARRRIASKVGVTPGTLENLRKGRLKSIAAHVYDRLHLLFVTELRAEEAAHEHELETLMATGADPRGSEVAEVEANLRKIRAILIREERR
jgi:uncharacterized hydantoinase/oxoprolinase family protein